MFCHAADRFCGRLEHSHDNGQGAPGGEGVGWHALSRELVFAVCSSSAATAPASASSKKRVRARSACWAFSLAKARGWGDRGAAISTRSNTWASRTSASPLAGQCLPCQDGTYILGGGGKECTPCPSGSGFCPGKNIVIPERGHWQAQRCRSGRILRHTTFNKWCTHSL